MKIQFKMYPTPETFKHKRMCGVGVRTQHGWDPCSLTRRVSSAQIDRPSPAPPLSGDWSKMQGFHIGWGRAVHVEKANSITEKGRLMAWETPVPRLPRSLKFQRNDLITQLKRREEGEADRVFSLNVVITL